MEEHLLLTRVVPEKNFGRDVWNDLDKIGKQGPKDGLFEARNQQTV
jgi:hypothetical protein